MSKSSKHKDKTSKLAVAGLLASAAAGAVYLYGKDGKRRREKLRGWMLKVKGEVMEKAEQAETLTKDEYHKLVDQAIDKYKGSKSTTQEEITRIRERLKNHWHDIASGVYGFVKRKGEAGSETINSIVSKAVAEAVEELSEEKDNDDIDAQELVKRVTASGVEGAMKEVGDKLGDSSENE